MPYILDTIKKPTWIFLMLLLILTGCGDDDSASSDAGDGNNNADVVPTMPAAQFTSVGAQSGLTETTNLATPTAKIDDGPDLAVGERVYTNRCAECHGANAEGGSATSLVGLTLDETTFEDLLRTGGELGSEHVFGTRAVSQNGLVAMYAWLQSLNE
ncbi:MAG: cytochrome c [Chloroflexota bacterium]